MKIRIVLAALAAGSTLAHAQSPDALYVRTLAASCTSCHGTNGQVVQGSAVPALAGMPRDHMLAQLKAFRDGSRPATVMHQIAKGYNEAQLQQLSTYFAAQAK
jgi:sulfide dehydrogenase cytochrome subunit